MKTVTVKKMQQHIVTLFAGALFGLGLSVAQMIDPAKVVGFLNIFGQWDPSLAFVMGGGLIVNALATPLILKRERPIYQDVFRIPAKTDIDRNIIGGGILFGMGWGLAGYCPGPLVTSLSFVTTDVLLVFAAYAVGTFATKWVIAKREKALHIRHSTDEACVD